MAYQVTTTYTRPDESVQYWEGGHKPEVLFFILENYIQTGKILSEQVYHDSATIKRFVRVFDAASSFNSFRDDMMGMGVRADRNSYCANNNITISTEEAEITLS